MLYIAGGEKTMATNSNKKLFPEAMSALDKFKYVMAEVFFLVLYMFFV